jgi:uncharacterized protein (DUF1501 family)
MRCAAITKGGSRCKLDATPGSNYCWNHAPENAEARSRRARRGGKARGASEMAELKREIRRVIEAVDSGETERGVGAVLFQGFNTLLKAVETERRIAEQEEVLERIAALEESTTGGARWRA